jgi:hypothetical protein
VVEFACNELFKARGYTVFVPNQLLSSGIMKQNLLRFFISYRGIENIYIHYLIIKHVIPCGSLLSCKALPTTGQDFGPGSCEII